MADRNMSEAELHVLEAELPPGLTPDMRDVAMCLFEAQVMQDERAGCANPLADPAWLEQLQAFARLALLQLQHLAAEKGGRHFYLAKGVAVFLSARDRDMCAKFKGNNYKELAHEYGLTEMRVRQVVSTWSRLRFLEKQGDLLAEL